MRILLSPNGESHTQQEEVILHNAKIEVIL